MVSNRPFGPLSVELKQHERIRKLAQLHVILLWFLNKIYNHVVCTTTFVWRWHRRHIFIVIERGNNGKCFRSFGVFQWWKRAKQNNNRGLLIYFSLVRLVPVIDINLNALQKIMITIRNLFFCCSQINAKCLIFWSSTVDKNKTEHDGALFVVIFWVVVFFPLVQCLVLL